MNQQTNATYFKWLYVLTGLAVLVNFSALFVTIIGPDGTFYAGIAKTMVLRHNYVELYAQGRDFLDKPHFPFWITALFFKLFGFKTWAYKLPGILFLMMGAVYTYLFAKKLYHKEIAIWAVLILLTAEHIIISNNDVRAEPYLTGLIIASVYHFYNAYNRNSYRQLILGCLFAAMAIMTKGIFAIIPIGGAIAGHFIITRQWKQLFSLRSLVALLLTGIFILPEIYCLYVQFDLHPEKLVFGTHHVSGIRFFFWDSQFGRFFNTGPIKGSGDPFFFVHTLLWAFLPWSLLLFTAIYQSIKKHYHVAKQYQWYCLCGSLLTFLVFSASRFQLPYYLNIVFPFFAIQLADYLYHVQLPKSRYAIGRVQSIVIVLLFIVVGALAWFFRPDVLIWPASVLMALLLILLMSLPKHIGVVDIRKTIIRTIIAAFIINLYLNLVFYPALLKYQSGSEAAFLINKQNRDNLPVAQTSDLNDLPMAFYLDRPLVTVSADGKGPVPPRPFYLYGTDAVVKGLAALGWRMDEVKTFHGYWISRLKPAFLNRNTRATQLDTTKLMIVR